MQDAAIDSNNTGAYGDGTVGDPATGSTNVNSSGKFEYVRATGAVTAGSIGISGAGAGSGLINSYTDATATGAQGQRRFQVVRVPQYSTATLGSGLTAAAWNGSTGGILAVDVTGSLALGGATVDVSGLGFRGGGGRQLTGAAGGSNSAYRSPATSNYHGQKGEGIAGTPRYVRNGTAAATDTGVDGYPNGSSARGAPATAGGGGTDGNPTNNDQNSGGGGGANGGGGGQGGNTWSSNLGRGGHGGTAYAAGVTQFVLGGGGGAGTRNNSPGIAAASAGGNGGGMVMVRAGSLTGSATITSDGQSGVVPLNDAGGGGGAGGSVMVLSAGGGTGGLTVNARGGAGGDGEQGASGAHGPGGGGGGGAVVLSGTAAGVDVAGGGAGDTNNGSGSFIAYGATGGSSGTITTTETLGAVPGTSSGTECTAQLTVTKSTITPVVVESGSGAAASYTITVANASGRAAATGVSISDALPAGFTFASTTSVDLSGGATRPSTSNPGVGSAAPAWGSFAIPGGGQVQINFTTAVAAGTTPATYQNPATATYTDPARVTAGGTTSTNYDPAGSTGEDVQVRRPVADVAVIKTVSTTTPALGANVTFTVTVTNNGPELATAVSVEDALPAGLTLVSATPSVGGYDSGTGTWTAGNLADGASATLSVVATVTTHTALTNTATASTTSTDSVPGNDSASASVNTPDADLAVAKTVSDANPPINSNVTFTVSVANNGPDTAQGVSVADVLPPELTFVSATPSVGAYDPVTGEWTVGNLADGASATMTLVVTVGEHTPITNTATATSELYDPNPADNTAFATVDVPDADLSLAKIVDDTTPPVGGVVTFTLTVTNDGPDDAFGVEVTDLLPPGLSFVSSSLLTYDPGMGVWTVGSLASGASAALDIVATATGPTAVTNAATASSPLHDPVPANNAASIEVDAVATDLRVAKSVDDPTPALGDTVTFTVTVTNDGPDVATAVSVLDALPPGLAFQSASASAGTYAPGTGTWAVGALANGAGATLTIDAQVTSAAALVNTATATAATPDPDVTDNTATASVDVPEADLRVAKTVDDPTPALGGTVTYTVTVVNDGPDPAAAVEVADPLPAALALISATPSTGAYAGGTWTVGGLASGAGASLLITAQVTADAAITNSATATAATHDPDPADNTASVGVDVPTADVSVVKTVDDAAPPLGGNVTFTLTVTNNGPDAARAVTVADTLPAGMGLVSASASTGTYSAGTWTIGTVAPGATASLGITAQVTSLAPLTNTATVATTSNDTVPGNDVSAVGVDARAADLGVTKSVDDPGAAPGATVQFTITVTNDGPDAATGVVVSDPLPAGLAFASASPSTGTYDSGTGAWTVGGLANGATATLLIGAQVTTAGAVTNTATVTGGPNDPNPANDSASADIAGVRANLGVTKSVDDPSPALGGAVTFTVRVANAGPDAAAAVTVTDLLPPGLTFLSAAASTGSYNFGSGVWTVGALGAGADATLDVHATVGAAGSIVNSATAASPTFDPDAADNIDTAVVNVPDANLAVTKSVDDATPSLGGQVTYLVTVTNAGPDPATGVVVSDPLPAGLVFASAIPSTGTYAPGSGDWTVGTLAAGAAATVSLTADVTSPAAIVNTATATAATLDPDPSDNAGSVQVDVPESDVAVTKAVDDPAPALGSDVTFTVTVTNNGPDSATGVTVDDTLPAGLAPVSLTPSAGTYSGGTWTVGALPSGASETLTVVATVTSAAPIMNTATASSTSFDGTPGNDSDAATVDVPEADLAVTKSASSTSPSLGGNVTFTLTVVNNGPSLAQSVAVADALPAGLSLVSASSAAYSAGVWMVGDLANGATATLDIVAQVTDPAAIVNQASVASATLDPNGANDADSVTVDVPEADLTLTKTVDDPTPAEGQNVTYTITLANGGPDAAAAVQVTDLLPAGLTFVSATPDAGSFSAGVWTVPAVPNGASYDLRIVARVDAQGIITNAAEVTSSATLDPTSTPGDGVGDDAGSVAVDGQPASADLSLTKAASNAAPNVGGTVRYTLTVANAGPSPATGVSVVDLLPAGVTFQTSAASQGAYDAGSGTWTVGGLAPGAAASATIDVRVDQVGAIVNSAEVGSSDILDPDSTPANGPVAEDDRDSVTITAQDILPPAQADLEIVKSASRSTATVGDTITYAVVVTNSGPAVATNVRVVELLPVQLRFVSTQVSSGSYDPISGVWAIPSVADAGSASLILTATVVAPGAVTNTVQILSSDQPDPDGPFNPTPGGPGSGQSSATVSVSPLPLPATRLGITKTGPKVVRAGNDVTFTIVVRNTGTVPATNVALADCIPSGLYLRTTQPRARLRHGRLTWNLGSLAPGQTRVVRVLLRTDRDTRGFRGCAAVVAGANAGAARATARVRVVAGASRPVRPTVAG